MIRQKFVYKDGKAVPVAASETPERKNSIPFDQWVDGVEHPATGEVIYSKSQYKKITKAHGLEEAYGEDKKYWQKPDDSAQKEADLEDDVLKSYAELNYGEGLTEEEMELCRQKQEAIDWAQENS